jgi:hypothetical protein
MEFSVMCQVCKKDVDSFSQNIRFILIPAGAIQERETIELSCGCIVDLPDWRIDVQSGTCQIYNFAETLYITFQDDEMIYEEGDED